MIVKDDLSAEISVGAFQILSSLMELQKIKREKIFRIRYSESVDIMKEWTSVKKRNEIFLRNTVFSRRQINYRWFFGEQVF